MTIIGFWWLIQKWKMGCTLQRDALQGRRFGFPAWANAKKEQGCEESRFMSRGKGMCRLLCARRKGHRRRRHGQVSPCLEMLRRLLTLKECQMRRPSGQKMQQWAIWVVWGTHSRVCSHPLPEGSGTVGDAIQRPAAGAGTRLSADVVGWSVYANQQFQSMGDVLASGQIKCGGNLQIRLYLVETVNPEHLAVTWCLNQFTWLCTECANQLTEEEMIKKGFGNAELIKSVVLPIYIFNMGFIQSQDQLAFINLIVYEATCRIWLLWVLSHSHRYSSSNK